MSINRRLFMKKLATKVDGARSFALLDFKIPDLESDYYATSLHKWMCGGRAPGSGV